MTLADVGVFISTFVKAYVDANRTIEQETEVDFYVTENGTVIPKEYGSWIGTSRRNDLLNSVTDSDLKNAVNQLYRPGSIIGDGGTADSIRGENQTGLLLSNVGHTQKGAEMMTYLQRIINSNNLSSNDLKIAQELLLDLSSALGGK